MGSIVSSPLVRLPAAAVTFGGSEALYEHPGQFGFEKNPEVSGVVNKAVGGILKAPSMPSLPQPATEPVTGSPPTAADADKALAASSSVEAATARRRKAAQTPTVLTTPLGVQDQAPVKRRSLLGQ